MKRSTVSPRLICGAPRAAATIAIASVNLRIIAPLEFVAVRMRTYSQRGGAASMAAQHQRTLFRVRHGGSYRSRRIPR